MQDWQGQPVEPTSRAISSPRGGHGVRGRRDLPDESALHAPSVSALAVADGVIRYEENLRFVSTTSWTTRRTRSASKEAYARLTDELEFDNLLVAHGRPIAGGARQALREFATA